MYMHKYVYIHTYIQPAEPNFVLSQINDLHGVHPLTMEAKNSEMTSLLISLPRVL